MDCDYDPTKKNKKEGKGRRARDKHRRTTVSEAVSREKPLFDPIQHCSFQDYLDQYYGIDCEDFIGDQPCRFKYKRVTANNYGLSVEEILAADDKELERWCSMKRIHKVGSEHKEKNDAKMYSKKAKDAELKKKILPSLFSVNSGKELENEEIGGVKKKIKKKKKKLKQNLNDDSVVTSSGVKKEENNETKENGENQINSTLDQENVTEHSKLSEDVIVNKKVKKRQRKHTNNDESNKMEENLTENKVTNANGVEHVNHTDQTKPKQKMKKIKHDINSNNQDIDTQNNTIPIVILLNNNEEKVGENDDSVTSKKKKKENNIKLNINGLDLSNTEGKSRRQKKNQKAKLLKNKKKKTHKYSETLKIADKYEKIIMKKNAIKEKKNDNKIQISDERLKAYGIKPKVFKDKLKYGTQFSMFLDG